MELSSRSSLFPWAAVTLACAAMAYYLFEGEEGLLSSPTTPYKNDTAKKNIDDIDKTLRRSVFGPSYCFRSFGEAALVLRTVAHNLVVVGHRRVLLSSFLQGMDTVELALPFIDLSSITLMSLEGLPKSGKSTLARHISADTAGIKVYETETYLVDLEIIFQRFSCTFPYSFHIYSILPPSLPTYFNYFLMK